MNLLLLAIFAALMQAIRSFDSVESGGAPGTTLALGYLLLTGHFAGRLFKTLRLPKLTGYIAAGIVVGPSVLGYLNESMVENLKLVNGVAVALIALTAGTELSFRQMRGTLRTVLWISGLAVVGTTVLLSGAVLALRALLPFMAALTLFESAMIALVLGVVMVAQSPAVVMALRDETESDGPVSQTVLGVVVLADLLVIVMFAVTTALAKAAMGGGTRVAEAASALAWELFGSLGLGLLVGGLLALFARRVASGLGLFLLVVMFAVAEGGQRLHLDALLVALAAGVFIRNVTGAAEKVQQSVEAYSLPIYTLFFAVAGANLHLDVLSAVGPAAMVFVLVRGVGLYQGTRVAARIAGASPAVQRFAGFGLLPQAGLALALSLLFARTFPEFGSDAGALTLGVVALNELIAPVFFRLALIRSGEAGRRRSGMGTERSA